MRHLLHPNTRLAIGAVAISFSGVWVTIAQVSASSSAFYRVFFGLLFLIVFAIQRRDITPPRPSHFFLALLCGLLFALDLYCWHKSIRLVGPGLATLLGNCQVFVLAGVGIFLLKERYSGLLLLALPLAAMGLFFIIGLEWPDTTANHRLGVYFGLATALFYACYIISLKYLSGVSTSTIQPMLLVSFTTAIFLGIYILSGKQTLVISDLPSLFSLLSLGFFSQCLGWLLIATSLPRTNTTSAGLILLLQPSLAFFWDVLFFARPTSWLNWLGVAITLGAIYLGLLSRREKV
ncbi:MAG: DMT family transporter [Desulfopila sp.]